jgi:hypothetical protein
MTNQFTIVCECGATNPKIEYNKKDPSIIRLSCKWCNKSEIMERLEEKKE